MAWLDALDHFANAAAHLLDHANAKQAEKQEQRAEKSAARNYRATAPRTKRIAGFASSDPSCCVAKRPEKP